MGSMAGDAGPTSHLYHHHFCPQNWWLSKVRVERIVSVFLLLELSFSLVVLTAAVSKPKTFKLIILSHCHVTVELNTVLSTSVIAAICKKFVA